MTEPNTLHPHPLAGAPDSLPASDLAGLRRPQRQHPPRQGPKAPASEPGWGVQCWKARYGLSGSNELPGAGRSSSGSRGCYWWLPFSGERCCKGRPVPTRAHRIQRWWTSRVKLPRVQRRRAPSLWWLPCAVPSEDEGSKAVVLLINSQGQPGAGGHHQ